MTILIKADKQPSGYLSCHEGSFKARFFDEHEELLSNKLQPLFFRMSILIVCIPPA